MEKTTAFKPKGKIFRLLSFQNPAYSPNRDNRLEFNPQKCKAHLHKGFSGPIISMIPAEARCKSKSFETQEPTSPKVSCMGQIKHKHKIAKQKRASYPKEFKHASHPQPENCGKKKPPPPRELTKKPSAVIKKIFAVGRKSDDYGKPPLPDRAPSISQMRRFASSRDTFANFDWTTAGTAREEDRDSYSDEDSDGEDDVSIPFSAPILVASGGGRCGGAVEPRKEINLWKRRTMAQPKPLQLDMVRAR